jgi:tripartite-type tricarboxylate transporter receptor subunit TctC
MKSRFAGLGMVPVGNSPAELAAAMREESQQWARIVRERKLEIE